MDIKAIENILKTKTIKLSWEECIKKNIYNKSLNSFYKFVEKYNLQQKKDYKRKYTVEMCSTLENVMKKCKNYHEVSAILLQEYNINLTPRQIKQTVGRYKLVHNTIELGRIRKFEFKKQSDFLELIDEANKICHQKQYLLRKPIFG
jgi:hypothetical protein